MQMAREARVQEPGACYHVFSRGDGGAAILARPSDKDYFLQCLSSGMLEYDATCHAYCIMNTHYHLILETPQDNLSDVMHFVGTTYGTRMSYEGWIGHVFSSRYKSKVVVDVPYLMALSRYIHRNPVSSHMVGRPHEYRWSSFPFFIRRLERPLWLKTETVLSIFANDYETARERFAAFVESDSLDSTPLDSLPPDLDPFHLHCLYEKPYDPNDVLETVCDYYGISDLILSDASSKVVQRAKHVFIYLARQCSTATNVQLADMLGKVSKQAISQQYIRVKESLELFPEIELISNSLTMGTGGKVKAQP